MNSASSFRPARIAVAVGLALSVALGAGCGTNYDDGDLEAGKQTFQNLCASCHSLADAGATGSDYLTAAGSVNEVRGPDLDDAFRAARQAGMSEAQFAGLVRRWISIAQPPMPRDLVEGQEAIDVAAYVASVAGRDDESVVRRAAPEIPQDPQPPRQELN
jgi:cytochrome c